MGIVELTKAIRNWTPLFGTLELMMLGVRFRIPRYVWSVVKPWERTGSGEGCPSGHHLEFSVALSMATACTMTCTPDRALLPARRDAGN